MKFKHTFSVFLDNFSTNYKLLVYGLIVLAVTAGLSCAILIPLLGSITGTAEYAALELAFSDMWQAVINLETGNLHNLLLGIQDALDSFIAMLGTKTGLFALCAVLLIIVYLINRFLSAIGAYTMGCVVNDKMALRANSSFLYSMTKNLGKASRFSLIYVPVCFVYDFICTAICILVMSVSPMLIKFFSFTVLLILFTAIKNTLICDWLPAVVHGKMPNGKALKFALSRKGKNTAYIFSNLLIIELIVVAPKSRDFSKSMNKKAKVAALISALSKKVADGEVVVVDKLEVKEGKTKEMAAFQKALSLDKTAVVYMDQADEKVILAARNLERLETLPVEQISVYEVVANAKVVLTKAAVEKIEEAYGE